MRRQALAVLVVTAALAPGATPANSTGDFISARGDKLYDGDEEFRFISFNIPNLHYVEDDMRFDQPLPFRWPTEYEIRDALESVRLVGGQVARPYALSVRKADDPEGMPRHVLGPGEFDEEGFEVLDTVLAVAGEKGIRLIIPLVDNWHWWGGVAEYAAFRGKPRPAFWTDRQLIDDYKRTIRFVLERINTRTGVAYRDDPSVLAWETGNELHSPHHWTREIARYIKSLDPNHLVLDGRQEEVLERKSVANRYVDVVQTHHYEKDPRAMIAHITKSAARARGRKPYHVGEFGFLTTAGMTAVMDTIIDQGTGGALVWSLRSHNHDGGFYWHHEPSGGDLFKAYHWPGFASGEAYDEIRLLAEMRRRAFEIRGLPAPEIEPPAPPEVIEVTSGGLLTWRGSAGASGYDIERAGDGGTEWQVIARAVSDADVQYRPLYADETVEPGRAYRYRLRARNEGGVSAPSEPFAAVTMSRRTLVDELRNEARMLLTEGTLRFRSSEARKYKEDAHGLEGAVGAALTYRTPEPLRGGRLYLFAGEAGDHLEFQVSRNGERFHLFKAVPVELAAGDVETYGYKRPFLYRFDNPPADVRFLRIEFRGGDVRLARVELEY